MTYDVLHTISRWTKERMSRLGATVTDTLITATEEQIWHGLSASQRRLLELRGNLNISDANGGDENVLQLNGENLQLGGEDLTLGA